MKVTLSTLGWALLLSIVLSIVAWFWLVLNQFNLTHPWTQIPDGLIHTFTYPSLRPIGWQSLLFGFGSVSMLLYVIGDWSESAETVLRGARVVSSKQLAGMTRTKSAQVTVADVPIPVDCEPVHILAEGSTGVGKSTALDELIITGLERGDRFIVIDPQAHAMSRFFRKGDVVLNPFDLRSLGWSLFNEIHSPYDFERIARSVVPDAIDPGNQAWHGYAQQLLAGIMRIMMQAGENSTSRLLYWVKDASSKELGDFLAGSAASGLFEPNAEKALASTRFILSHHLAPYQYLKEGEFSLRKWLESGKGNLYITWREDMLDSLRPLVSTWADILIASILTLPKDKSRRIWLILDELASLERLNSLEAGLTKGRKQGLCIVAGVQSIAQLDQRYGRNAAQTLRSCFRNVLALGCSNNDPDTAVAIAKGLGQVEIERTTLSYSRGKHGTTTNSHTQRHIEDLVLPAELMSLKPLHGYLKLAGDYPVARVSLVPRDLPVRIKPFVER